MGKLWKTTTMNANTREAVTTIALFIFTLSAFALPVIIGHFSAAFNKRLKRLDEAIDIFTETNKYHDGKEENKRRGQFPGD